MLIALTVFGLISTNTIEGVVAMLTSVVVTLLLILTLNMRPPGPPGVSSED